ncbi:Pao retrotransposon peptidase [Popillia japonica]|uniref:Pao retrotransposon peptidase n=1 Tax=Popillia japonica TaxID=7064 RepID=A0AAW1LRA2_POPJA
MYRQRLPTYSLAQEQPQDELKYYRLNTVTYGTAPASFLAVRALHQAAMDNGADPRVINIIKSDFYMDDLITGTDTLEDAVYLKHQISDVLQRGCFPLRKWRSNEKEILGSGSIDSKDEYVLADKGSIKTLGLLWNSQSDTLHYSVNLDIDDTSSKRKILSTIAKIFDPLGLVSPVTIRAKLIMQYLWQYQIDWDEELPDPIRSSWQEFHAQLSALNNIKIARQVIIRDVTEIQLHGFCDASERAYGACVYIRSTDTYGNHCSNLLCAKSRVAPLKKTSLPRLELCGAVLLSRLVRKVCENFRVTFGKRRFWCDSTIALAWIRTESVNWKTFVANRKSGGRSTGIFSTRGVETYTFCFKPGRYCIKGG